MWVVISSMRNVGLPFKRMLKASYLSMIPRILWVKTFFLNWSPFSLKLWTFSLNSAWSTSIIRILEGLVLHYLNTTFLTAWMGCTNMKAQLKIHKEYLVDLKNTWWRYWSSMERCNKQMRTASWTTDLLSLNLELLTLINQFLKDQGSFVSL